MAIDERLFYRPDGKRWIDCEPLVLQPAITSKALQLGYGRVQASICEPLESIGGIKFANETCFEWDYRLFFGWPRAWMIGHDFVDGIVQDALLHTMYEAEELPPGWVDVLNRFRLVWVPSKWCHGVFLENGVTAPMMVSGYGVDDIQFPYMPRHDEEPFTFITVGHSMFGRKRVDMVWKCFNVLKLKGELKDARLLVKTQKGLVSKETWLMNEDGTSKQAVGSNGVEFVYETLDTKGYSCLLGHAHCLVYPQMAEGFGLIPLEFMATGGCAMVTDKTGCTEYLREDVSVLLPPDVTEEALMDRMLWAYNNRSEVREIGERAAKYVRAKWSWFHAGARARTQLYEHLGR